MLRSFIDAVAVLGALYIATMLPELATGICLLALGSAMLLVKAYERTQAERAGV